MLKGGCDFGPRAVSTRLLGGTWWVFTLVIISAYTANLAAVLTVSRPYIPIKNLDDLANQTVISYGAQRGGSTMQFFQESRIPAHMKMWNYMKDRDVFADGNQKGVERALRGNYAFLMESTSLEFEVQQNCNLTQIGGVLGSKGYGIALAKKSEWTDRFSRQILLYAKQGVIEMKKTKWWRSKGAACAATASSVKQQRFSLSMSNVAGLFIILAAGLAVGVFTVIIELFIRAKEVADQEQKPLFGQIIYELRFALNLNRVEDHPSRKKSSQARNPSQSVPDLTVTEGLPVTCPSGYTYFATTGYCYAVKTGTGLAILQNDAEAACVADGGHLASIHSQAENDFLFGLAKTGSLIGVAIQPWIGLEQTTNELGPFPLGTCGATFKWTDNTAVDYGPIWYGSSLGIPANPTCTLSILGCTLFVADTLPAPFNILTPNGEWFQFPCATLLATRYICKRLPL